MNVHKYRCTECGCVTVRLTATPPATHHPSHRFGEPHDCGPLEPVRETAA